MAIEQLTDEQVRTWTIEQKDRWWLTKIYRGDMPQLTVRAAITGFFLGGLLSATNLYVGAKTGWTLGVGLTSVVLAFGAFRMLAKFGARDFTILENNALQSIATSAGYMTSPLIGGFAAYMWVIDAEIPWWKIMGFNVVLSLLGVMVAFPMKRRFINDEQQSFPEGRACGVVLDTLYSSDASVGLFKAKVLAITAGSAALLKFISSPNTMQLLQQGLLRMSPREGAGPDGAKFWYLNEHLDAWYYWLAEKGWLPVPKLSGIDIRNLGLSPTMELAMVGAGGLMGLRSAASMLIGMLLNFVVVIPWMVSIGEIKPKPGQAIADITRVWAVNSWALWWGITLMIIAALVGFAAKPQVIVSAFRGLFKKRTAESDVLRHIEVPLWISLIGVPVLGAAGVWVAASWFDVDWRLGALAIPLIIVLSLIAANSTALTGITPTGTLSKIPQFIFGTMAPKHPATNMMTALMAVEVASNSCNLLMDIKPGYMLGAKPRQQAVGHVIGIFSGAIASTWLYYIMFLSGRKPGESVMDRMTQQFGFPSAIQWKGISDLINSGFSALAPSAIYSMIIAGVFAIVLEVWRIASKQRMWLSPMAVGLGVVLPPDSTVGMFAGALLFTSLKYKYTKREGTLGHKLWVETAEPICAGMIAGFALMGISDVLIKVFVYPG